MLDDCIENISNEEIDQTGTPNNIIQHASVQPLTNGYSNMDFSIKQPISKSVPLTLNSVPKSYEEDILEKSSSSAASTLPSEDKEKLPRSFPGSEYPSSQPVSINNAPIIAAILAIAFDAIYPCSASVILTFILTFFPFILDTIFALPALSA